MVWLVNAKTGEVFTAKDNTDQVNILRNVKGKIEVLDHEPIVWEVNNIMINH